MKKNVRTPSAKPSNFYFIKILILLLMAQAMVIPHSVQLVTAGTLITTFVVALYYLSRDRKAYLIAIDYWIPINIIINAFYIFVGFNNQAYEGFVPVVLVSSIISPILWIWTAKAIHCYLSENEIIRGFYWLSILGAASVALFFFLFLNFGAYAVGFWFEEDAANVYVSQGQIAATMVVYGSFIFSTAAFASTPEIVRSLGLRILILLILFAVAFTSGRSALMVSVAIGAFIGVLIKFFNQNQNLKGISGKAIATYFVLAIMAALFVSIIDALSTDIDLSVTLGNLFEKLSDGGGELRQWQYDALLQGIRNTNGLGAGHGVGVSLIRNAQYPWRYELTPLATIFRVGLIGFALLMLPYVLYMGQFVRRLLTLGVDAFDAFMFAGFTSFIAASFTNPYSESFIFQFMLYIPIVLFEMKYRRRQPDKSTSRMTRPRLAE